MGPLTDAEMPQRLASSAQVQEVRDGDRPRERARDAERARRGGGARRRPRRGRREDEPAAPAPRGRAAKEPPTAFEKIIKSPVTRTVAGAVTRGLMGALLGSLGIRRSAPRRRRRY